MKTVVRLLIAAGIVFTAVFLTSACKDDDKDNQTTIIGSWQLDQSRVDVDLIANPTFTEEEIEAEIAEYIQIAVKSRVVFTNTKVTFPLSLAGGKAQNVTYDYTVNDDVISFTLPEGSPSNLLGDLGLTDNILKITLDEKSFTTLLQELAKDDANFKKYVDEVSSASVFYRLTRI